MKRISLILTVLLFLGYDLSAQQAAMFTHYMYNTLWLNPAYAGSRDAFTVTGIYRSQWTGFDGAPVDQTLTMHLPTFNGKMGIGLSVINDKIGPVKNTTLALDLAYHVRLSKRSKLSFGLKGALSMYRNNLSQLKLVNPADIAFAQNVSQTLPNIGAGIYYYRERFYIGVSSPQLVENKLNGSISLRSSEQRHYYLIAGTVLDLSQQVKLKPTCFIKSTEAAPIEADITASFLFYDQFSIGAMYRTGDALGALVSFTFANQLTLGYSFDWSMANTTGRYNSGSHEIMLRYDMIPKMKVKSPRYF